MLVKYYDKGGVIKTWCDSCRSQKHCPFKSPTVDFCNAYKPIPRYLRPEFEQLKLI